MTNATAPLARHAGRIATALLACALLASCATPPCRCPDTKQPTDTATPPPVTARHVAADWSQLPGWPGATGELLASWPAWLQSCTRLQKREGWQAACDAARALAPADDTAVRRYFEQHFAPWQLLAVTGDDPPRAAGLITGYYEPLLTGSRTASPTRAPLYGVPDDLLTIDLAALYPELKGLRLRGRLDGKRVVPYHGRSGIDAGALDGHADVLVWADDPVDAFFLQVQGSGRVQLEDGTLLRVGYADQNGHPYRAIGKWLVEQGELALADVSMQRIRAWAEANPARVRELLAANPSYVFFRLLPDTGGGPLGAFNVPLTAEFSVAVDRSHIALGTPLWLDTTRPDAAAPDAAPLQRLVHAQDTGGAVRGPVRADFFWGFGAGAGALAGLMKQEGRLWVLWPVALGSPAPAPR